MIGTYCLRPFRSLETDDLLAHPASSEEATTELRNFMAEFANHLSLQVDRSWMTDVSVVSEDDLLLMHPAMRAHLDPLRRDLAWPDSWRFEALEARNSLSLLLHVQGLAPWEVAALGSPEDLAVTLLESGEQETLPSILASLESPFVRSAMAAAAIERIVTESLARGPEDEVELAPGDLALCAAICQSMGQLSFDQIRPVDGARYSSLEAAGVWVPTLAGVHGLLPLVCLLYGTRIDGDPDQALEQAVERAELLTAAARGRAEWALRGMNDLPGEWANPMVLALLRGQTVADRILSANDAELEEEIARIDTLRPDALRAAVMARSADALFRDGRPALTQLLASARPVHYDESAPLPTSYNPPVAAWAELLARHRDVPGAAAATVAAFGSPLYAPEPMTEDWRVPALLGPSTDPGHKARARHALELMAQQPMRFVDPLLLDGLRGAAR